MTHANNRSVRDKLIVFSCDFTQKLLAWSVLFLTGLDLTVGIYSLRQQNARKLFQPSGREFRSGDKSKIRVDGQCFSYILAALVIIRSFLLKSN